MKRRRFSSDIFCIRLTDIIAINIISCHNYFSVVDISILIKTSQRKININEILNMT